MVLERVLTDPLLLIFNKNSYWKIENIKSLNIQHVYTLVDLGHHLITPCKSLPPRESAMGEFPVSLHFVGQKIWGPGGKIPCGAHPRALHPLSGISSQNEETDGLVAAPAGER